MSRSLRLREQRRTRSLSARAREPTLPLARFALVGAGGWLVNILVFALLALALRVPYAVAAAGSFAVAGCNNYLWNRLWRLRRRRAIPQRLRFFAISLAALGVNIGVLHVFVASGLHALPAQAGSIMVVTPLSFISRKLSSFPIDTAEGAGRTGVQFDAVWDSLAARAGAIAQAIGRYRTILLWWAASRLVVFVSVIAAQVVRWPRHEWYPSVLHQPFALLGAWDARWYRMVAARGYLVVPSHQSDTAFYPLFPALTRALDTLGLSWPVGALLLSNLGFLVALVGLYELARTWLPEADARRAAIYAAVFPFGFVFSMAYPESVVLAAITMAALAAARQRWQLAAFAAAVAALGRPQGVFVALPLAALAARAWPALAPRERGAALGAALAAPAAQLGLALYDWRTVGDPFAFDRAQHAWGRWTSADGIVRAFSELAGAPALDREWLFRDAAFWLVYVLCLAVALRAGVPRSWVAASALMILLPLETGSFTSMARFGLLAPAVYWGLARLGRRPPVDLALRVVATGLLAAGSATILLHWP